MVDGGETALRDRAFQLASTGDYNDWNDIREALLAEGYLAIFAEVIADDHQLHDAIQSACADAKDARLSARAASPQ